MRLQRMTSGSRWMPEIDGLRFIAIFSVLLTHVLGQMVHRGAPGVPADPSSSHLVQVLFHLGEGVTLFFMISGYILGRPFVRQHVDGGKPVDLKYFYLRRVTRLEPPYLLSLLIYFCALLAFRSASVHTLLLSLLSSVFYVNNFFLHIKGLLPLNFVNWSLKIEFYLLAPLLAQMFRIANPVMRRGVLVAVILGSTFFGTPWTEKVGLLFAGSFCYFMRGYLLADLRFDQRPELQSRWWDVLSLTVWPLCLLWPSLPWASVPLLYAPGFCLLLFLSFTASMLGPGTRRLLSLRPVALAGGMCYSIYLMHMLVLSAVFPHTVRWLRFQSLTANYLLELCLVLPCVFGAGLLYFLLVERPCMDPEWPQKLASRWRPAHAVGQEAGR